MRQSAPGATSTRPNQFSLLLHFRKTGMLVAAVMGDARVHPIRKLAFFGLLGLLMALMLVPELSLDAASLLVPVLGWMGIPFEIPAEAGVDWVVFGVAAFNLLKLFPTEVVGEHYDRLFRK